jgi:hypothetical protein
MPLQVIGGRTVYALDSQVAGIARVCAWVEAHRDPTLEFWDQYDACMRQSYWDRFNDGLSTQEPQPQPQTKRRQRKPSLARLAAKAKQLGVDVTIESNGAVTFHTGSSATAETTINEWDEVLPHYGKH